jgi:hypothetical protein
MSDTANTVVTGIQGNPVASTSPNDGDGYRWNATDSQFEPQPVPTWQGAWSSATSYRMSDAVSYNGSAYIAIQPGTNQEPDTSPTYWGVLAAQGSMGATGPTGATGATGPQGTNYNPSETSVFLLLDDFGAVNIGTWWSHAGGSYAYTTATGHPGVVQLSSCTITSVVGTSSFLPFNFIAIVNVPDITLTSEVVSVTVGPLVFSFNKNSDASHWHAILNGTDLGSIGSIASNTWYHLTASYDGTTFSITAGGAPVTPAAPATGTVSVSLGVTASVTATLLIDYVGLEITGITSR